MHLQSFTVIRRTSKTVSSPISLWNISQTPTLAPLFIHIISISQRHLNNEFSPSATSDDDSDESEDEDTLPPGTRHAPRRPKKRHIQTRKETSEETPARIQKCGRCRQSGHSRRT